MSDFTRFLAIFRGICEGVKQISRFGCEKKKFLITAWGGFDLHTFTNVFLRRLLAVKFDNLCVFFGKNRQKSTQVKLSEPIYIADMLLLGNFSLICEGCEMRDVHL